MAYGIKLKVWGDLALFTRPEMKVERVSYDVITPSAARGILEAIYWKPEMRWVVDRIRVLAPIQFTQVRRNEISSRIPTKGKVGKAMKSGKGILGLAVDENRQQRASTILKNVCYGLEAHVVITAPLEGSNAHPEAKHLEMFKRRAKKGQFFHHPYLGTREFPASFELVEAFPPCPESLGGLKDLGFMLHDIAFQEDSKGNIVESNRGRKLVAEPRFFRPTMVDGVIDVPPLEQSRS